ncbi:hypothetical protein [endosymbiont GvMRE of Glomus versiforme]|uniref:hypothetical protein n=1 Tax=endosymbiont GvMRE of Glomus versiforme TaxID=2039283 RepID=UPI0011C3456E|nr:hypothetical protein [endosymbiont GvMRE of Glomus versiforme]
MANAHNQIEQRLQELRNFTDRFNNLQTEHANLRVEKAQSDTKADFFGGQLVKTENELQITKTNLEEVRERFTNLVIAEKDKENDLKIILVTQEMERRNRERDLQKLRQELNETKRELEERLSPTDLQNLLFAHETEIRDKEQEIQQKNREIANLREQLGQSQEQSLNLELRVVEEEVEELANRLRINWERIQALRDSYALLIRSRRNNERANLQTSQNNIETIRQNLLQAEINISDVRRICRLCEQIAEMRSNQQQQFEAHTQVPPHRYY